MINNNKPAADTFEPAADGDSISTTNFGISTETAKVDKKKEVKKAIISSAIVFVLIATIGLSIGLSLGLKKRSTDSKNAVTISFDDETASCEEEVRKLLIADGIDVKILMKGMAKEPDMALIRRERPARRRLIHQLTNNYLDGNGDAGAGTHSAFLNNGYLLDRRRLSSRVSIALASKAVPVFVYAFLIVTH